MKQRKNTLMAKPTKSSGSSFQAAIQQRDVEAIRRLIASGYKPDAAAASEAVDACNRAFSIATRTEAPLFGRKPSMKEQEKAATEAASLYEIAEALLEAGAPVPEALCPAARSGNTKLALLLIGHGADVDYSPPMGTPLENAVTAGDLELVRALIKAKADIHCQGVMGTLLTRAVGENHLAVAEELIKAGVKVNAQPKFGSSALLKAVTERKSDFVHLLLNAGADVNQKGTVTCGEFGEPGVAEENGMRTTHIPNPPVAYDSTPLIVAVRRGYADVAALLLKAGADLEATDRDGFTALVHAMKSKNQELISLLQNTGARLPKHAEGSPEAALMAAAQQGNCHRVQALLDTGLDVNLKRGTDEESERTALIHAAENGQIEAVRLLLKAGARVDEKCGKVWDEAQNRTALMHAAKAGQLEIVRLLLEAGASVSSKDKEMEGGGRTPLHYAAEAGHAEVVRALVKAGAKVDAQSKNGETPLMAAAGEGHIGAVKVLLELGADPNFASEDGLTALYSAASKGTVKVVAMLLDAGANPALAGDGVFSPLEAASSEGHDAIVQLLLKAGASAGRPGSAAKADGSALVNAALAGQTKVMRTLLKAGANPNETDEEQFTPLMAAVRHGDAEVIRILLQAGAEVNATNKASETALDLAYDNIKAAKDQAKFLKMMGDLDEKARKAIAIIKKMGNEDDITQLLQEAGGKRAKDLKLKKKTPTKIPKEEAEPELKVPDFSEAAKMPAFKQAIEELTQICGAKPKSLAKEEGNPLAGCVIFRLSAEQTDRIIADHHQPFLARGCYLLRQERGYTSGKDMLAALPTTDWRLVLQAFQTNGANCDVYTKDVIEWLDNLGKEQPFLLTGAGFDWCEGRFTKPIKNSRKLAREMYEFCPDIVSQGVGDVARLANELKKTQKFFFWWD